MTATWSWPTASGEVVVRTSTRADGDFHLDHVDPATMASRRRAFLDAPWAMLDEVHGVEVVTVTDAAAGDRRRGDIAVTDQAGLVLGVWTGDCAPIVLVAPDGRLAAIHAGWRGLAAGIVDCAVDAVDPDGAGGVRAFVGPHIGPCCNEFGTADLARVAAGVGAGVAAITSSTSWGSPALDVAAAVQRGLARRGVRVDVDGRCTGHDESLFSHRRGDAERHVTAAWRVR